MKGTIIVDGTAFSASTPPAVRSALLSAIRSGDRVRLFYGDRETGRDWMEEFSTIGRVSRSCGAVKIPILISRSGSYGGGAILDDCIVKITSARSGRLIYQAPNYKVPDVGVQGSTVYRDGDVWARCRDHASAVRLALFYRGHRNSKGGTLRGAVTK